MIFAMRSTEALPLRVKNIDFGGNNIAVRGGKGVTSPADNLDI